IVSILVLPPLAMVVLSGINSQAVTVLSSEPFWAALMTSVRVASLASIIAVGIGIAILLTSRAWRLQNKNYRADKIELIGTIILVTPGLVISTGLFLLLRSFTDVFSLAFFIVVAVN
ncbi:thiamine/thiamine pyrophosphate ABC transporter permease ThiP, partial [Vibrio sp. 10N.222.54.F6]